MNKKTVVIVGGGFAGISAAKRLGRYFKVVVVDQNNYHGFQPLFFQSATGLVPPSSVCSPIRSILKGDHDAQVVLARVDSIDLVNKRVHASNGANKSEVAASNICIAFDYIVIASGAKVNFRGKDEWMQYAMGLKDLDDAMEIRKRVLLAFEQAETECSPDTQRKLLTIAIVGGGPTGVELAGAIAELSRTLASEYRNIDARKTRIILLQGGERVLPMFDPSLSAKAHKYLLSLGVEVMTKARVNDINDDGVTLADGTLIESSTVIWAAGVKANDLTTTLGCELDESGRVKVLPDLSVPGYSFAFAVGDTALVIQDGKPVPGVAPAASQAGRAAANCIIADFKGKPRKAFRYIDKGQLATIGRRRAIAQFGKWKFAGIFAWQLWLFVHVLFLTGYRNRITVLFEWFWSYVARNRGTRLITGHRRRAGAVTPEELVDAMVEA